MDEAFKPVGHVIADIVSKLTEADIDDAIFASGSDQKWAIRERRAYATKQRPITTTVHGPYPNKAMAQQEMLRMSRASARNDNRSSWALEPYDAERFI